MKSLIRPGPTAEVGLDETVPASFLKEQRKLITHLVSALLEDLKTSDFSGWEVLKALLRLPLDSDESGMVLLTVREHYSPARADLADAIGALRWNTERDVNEAALIAVLRAGPPQPWPSNPQATNPLERLAALTTDPIYSLFAIELTALANPNKPDLARALIGEGRVSSGAHMEVLIALSRAGCGELITEVRKASGERGTLGASSMLDRHNEAHAMLRKFIGEFATPAVSYGERRRMTELVDYIETAVPGKNIEAAAFEVMILDRPEHARNALKWVARLGGFNVKTLAAQVSALSEDGFEDALWLRFDALSRPLKHWPDGEARNEALANIGVLFVGTTWLGDIARRALEHYPVPAQAIRVLEFIFPQVTSRQTRWILAVTLLSLDPSRVDRARKWLQEKQGDAMLRRAAAVVLASLYVGGGASEADLEMSLRMADEAIREHMLEILNKHTSPRLSEILATSDASRPSNWVCMWCDHTNDPGVRSCNQCHFVR